MTLSNLLKYCHRLGILERFNTRPRIKKETVAEHSYFVTLITSLLCDAIILNTHYVPNKYLALKMALIHDLPESEFSDIPHDSKQKIPGLKDSLLELEMNFFKSEESKFCYKKLSDNNSLESAIVNYADILAVKYYAEQEISLGNTNFISILEETEKRLMVIENPNIEIVFKVYSNLIFDWRKLV